MNKKLLSIACVASLAISASAASDPGITELWKTPNIEELKGAWSAATDWSNPSAIKATSNPRFATAKDGKVYTINMKTMAIAEVTLEGLKDLYTLPNIDPDFYGTAISIDEAGNFLVGEDFVSVASAQKWTIYSPSTGQSKRFDIGVPEGWTLGRVDCVGRVLGDLTREALFFLAPNNDGTSKVRVMKATGNGTVNSVELTELDGVSVSQQVSGYPQNIVQPGFNTYAEYEAAGEDNYNFYYSACCSTSQIYTAYLDGKTTTSFAPDLTLSINAPINGFTTFTLEGKRYFVRSYSLNKTFDMAIAVTDANGDILTTWINNDWSPNGGYSSIIAEPVDDKTAYIYVYNSGNNYGAAAQLVFDPAQCGAPIVPEKPVGLTPDAPYMISTPAQFIEMASKISTADFYVALENDLDFEGIEYTPVSSTARIHFDGKNHVIRNVYTYDPKWDNWGLFKAFSGDIKNLGVEDSYHYVSSGCAGVLMGQANDVTIENCYVTGSVYAAAGGGMIGSVFGNTTITNSYSLVDVTGPANSHLGGLVGRVGSYDAKPGNLTVNYSYAGGSVISDGISAGIASSNVETSVIKIDKVIAWNTAVKGNVADAICAGLCDNAELEDFWIYDGLLLNGEPESGESQADLIAISTQWPGFNTKLNNGRVVLAWQEANGNEYALGSEANPIKLYTAKDVVNMRNYFVVGHNYITLENDIDMDGVEYSSPLNNNNFTGRIIHLDGKCHVISNLTVASGDYPSLLGVFMGDIKDLGLVNVDIKGYSAGVFGAFTGHTSYDGVTTIDNCFATGKVKGDYYAGGIGGYNNGQLKISNSYTLVSVEAGNFAGGVLGWVPAGVTTIENVYAGNYVEATNEGGNAGGIINLVDNGVATLNNVVSWGEGIYGSNVAFVNAGAVNATETNVYVGENALLNGEDAPEEGKTDEELQAVVCAWAAFSDKLVDGRPMLKWQADETGAVNEIEVDNTDANGPAVYYNLQGVEVANPENGIYIVRRGNKVTKEIVR